MENLQNEQTPAWAKPLEELVGTLNDMVISMSGTPGNQPAQPTKPAGPAKPVKTESELLADQINAGTTAITGKQTQSASVLSTPAPIDEAETKRLASLIDGETKQIVADQRDQQIRELTAQLTETQRMLSMKK